MKKNLTELVFILDRSGSMQGLEGDTIGGFNAMIEKQKKEPGEAFVSTVLFDDRSEVLHDRVKVGEVRPITEKEYYVRGCTALLDAIGGAIHHIGNIHKYARPEDVPEHTLFVITTDGMENASRRYSARRVKEMIQRQKEKYERMLAESEEKLAELQMQMLDPALASDYPKLMELQSAVDAEEANQDSLLERMLETETELAEYEEA